MRLHERDPECDGGFACLAPTHIEGCFTGEGHPDAIPAEVAELVVSLRLQLAGAANLLREARGLFQEDGTENGVDRRFIEGFEKLCAAIRLLEGH